MNPVPAVIYYQHCLKARRMRQICQKPEERWNKWEGNQYLCSSGLHCPDHSCGEHLQQAKPSCLEHHCPAVTVVHQLADRLQGHSITWKKRLWDEGNASTINHRNPKQQCCSPGLCSARLDCSPRVFHNPWGDQGLSVSDAVFLHLTEFLTQETSLGRAPEEKTGPVSKPVSKISLSC